MTSSSYFVYLSDCCHVPLYCWKWLNPGYTRICGHQVDHFSPEATGKYFPISLKAQYIIQIYIYSYTKFQVSHQIQGLPVPTGSVQFVHVRWHITAAGPALDKCIKALYHSLLWPSPRHTPISNFLLRTILQYTCCCSCQEIFIIKSRSTITVPPRRLLRNEC